MSTWNISVEKTASDCNVLSHRSEGYLQSCHREPLGWPVTLKQSL